MRGLRVELIVNFRHNAHVSEALVGQGVMAGWSVLNELIGKGLMIQYVVLMCIFGAGSLFWQTYSCSTL